MEDTVMFFGQNDTQTAMDTKNGGPVIEHLVAQSARYKASIAKWGLSNAVFLFALLIAVIILTSQGVGIYVVAPLSIVGLATVWIMGWRRGSQMYKHFYSEELSRIQEKPTKEAATFLAELTSREIGMLHYMAQGYANKQIASELGLSESTIKTHVSEILSKLDANDRTEAAVIAIKHGLIRIQ
ncbi:response regulator transcription factor [Chloroflexota bacterium]